ncbi:MAG: nascent polypeptide-associated complex protein [Candidatus Aenigmarchaeota archaeon]|nr:nascent polypeptide-associated complex protein [Candidatus Aenigmarchaeota archaeon]
MLGKIDPKKMEKLMKRLNMDVTTLDAEEVIIKMADKNIIISRPEIMIANMMGKEVYQISGEISESVPVKEEDILMVMEQTGKDRQTVSEVLERLNNDLAQAIKELKNGKK